MASAKVSLVLDGVVYALLITCEEDASSTAPTEDPDFRVYTKIKSDEPTPAHIVKCTGNLDKLKCSHQPPTAGSTTSIMNL